MSPAPLTLSSREIAELSGKEHNNVLRDIRTMLAQLGLDVLSFESTVPDALGRPQPVFHLPKDLTLTLVAGYSVPLRHRIVARWLELEASQAQALPAAPPLSLVVPGHGTLSSLPLGTALEVMQALSHLGLQVHLAPDYRAPPGVPQGSPTGPTPAPPAPVLMYESPYISPTRQRMRAMAVGEELVFPDPHDGKGSWINRVQNYAKKEKAGTYRVSTAEDGAARVVRTS